MHANYVQEVRYAAGARMRRSGVVQVVVKIKSMVSANDRQYKSDRSKVSESNLATWLNSVYLKNKFDSDTLNGMLGYRPKHG